MCQAFCSFVNDGVFTYSRTYSMVTDSKGNLVIDNVPRTLVAFEPNTAYTMTYMMKNVVSAGTGTEAYLYSVPVAGKTGTSGQYKDRWFVGCTPYYVAAVWTGFDTPEYIDTSGNPAARIYRSVMQPVHDGLPWKDFTYPYIGDNTGIFGLDEDDFEDEDDGNEDDYLILDDTDDYGDSIYIEYESDNSEITQPELSPPDTNPPAPPPPDDDGGDLLIPENDTEIIFG